MRRLVGRVRRCARTWTPTWRRLPRCEADTGYPENANCKKLCGYSPCENFVEFVKWAAWDPSTEAKPLRPMAAKVIADGKRLKAANNIEPTEEVADEDLGDGDDELYDGLAR